MNSLKRATLIAVVAPVAMMSAAYGADSKNQGYLTDRNGNAVTVRSGGCMHTRDWTPSRAIKPCDAVAGNASAQTRRAK